MKLAIITQALRTNYGGILQNYALQTVLKRKGHSVVTLQKNQKMQVLYPRYLLTIIKRIILKIVGSYRQPIFYEKKYNHDFSIVTKNTMDFVDKYISLKVFNCLQNEINETDFDGYVVGSDQVWRPAYNNLEDTFLSFTRGWKVKRYAYAASFGTDQWELTPEQTVTCAELLKNFDFITFREFSGVNLCSQHFKSQSDHVLDPTMLLDRSDYNLLIQEGDTHKSEGQLFVHLLDKTDDKLKLVDKISKEKQWDCFSVNSEEDEHNLLAPVSKRIQPSVQQWLRSFQEAQFVITDSFHATVFSIIFNKPFIVYANKDRGLARFTSLLEMFGIKNRIVTSSNEYSQLKICNIDYDEVNTIIHNWQIKSMSYIEKII